MNIDTDFGLRNTDWLRTSTWDLPTNPDAFLATLRGRTVAEFLTTPAAEAMPLELRAALAAREAKGLDALEKAIKEFTEELHPRDDHGRFTSTAGETNAGTEGQATLFDAMGNRAPTVLKAANVERIGNALIEQARTDPELRQQLQIIGAHTLALTGQEEMAGADWAANALQATWAESSSDASPVSIALQLAIDDHFSTGTDSGFLEDATKVFYASGTERGVNLTSSAWGVESPEVPATVADMAQALADSPVVNAYVDQVYNDTQAYLKDRGITEVTLYRGMNSRGISLTGPVDMNPLSSWSVNSGIASDFAANTGLGAVVFQATFPAERIFSVPQTGNGCLNEYEVTVIGGSTNVEVFE